MRKSELLAIKAREYERGLADAHKKFRIEEIDVREWAGEAQYRVQRDKDWASVEDAMKEMLREIGVEIIPLQEVSKDDR